MKIALAVCSLLLATALSARVFAQSSLGLVNDPAQQSDPDDGAPLTEPRHIGFGMTPDDVVIAMHGQPDAKLSPDIWVYWNFRVPTAPALQKFTTLVVFFSPERVYKYRLVERKVLAGLLADIRKTPTPSRPEIISESAVQHGLDDRAPFAVPRRIGLGMTPDDAVEAMHGNPDVQLSAGIWVYWKFLVSDDPGPKDADTLVVFFSQGRVSRYRLVERDAVLALLDERKA